LQISNKNIIDAQKIDFVPKFSQKGFFSAPNFAFLDLSFLTKLIFRHFSDNKNRGLLLPCHDASAHDYESEETSQNLCSEILFTQLSGFFVFMLVSSQHTVM